MNQPSFSVFVIQFVALVVCTGYVLLLGRYGVRRYIAHPILEIAVSPPVTLPQGDLNYKLYIELTSLLLSRGINSKHTFQYTSRQRKCSRGAAEMLEVLQRRCRDAAEILQSYATNAAEVLKIYIYIYIRIISYFLFFFKLLFNNSMHRVCFYS